LEECGVTKIKDVTTSEMMKYYIHLTERKNQRKLGTLSGSTIRIHLLSISIFLDNLLKNNEIEKAFHIPKHGSEDKNPRNILTVEEIEILYQNCENLLEKVLLSLAYGCGLRRSEMYNLNIADVQRQTGILVVRKGKFGKRRTVPMSDDVLKDVLDYFSDYRFQKQSSAQLENAFFINKRGKRMSGEMLNDTLNKIIMRTQDQKIIDKEITLHCLRHSIAYHLAENNAGIEFIKDFLGHFFINTTSIYSIKNKPQNRPIVII
jgi:integrase/recombinase XerD